MNVNCKKINRHAFCINQIVPIKSSAGVSNVIGETLHNKIYNWAAENKKPIAEIEASKCFKKENGMTKDTHNSKPINLISYIRYIPHNLKLIFNLVIYVLSLHWVLRVIKIKITGNDQNLCCFSDGFYRPNRHKDYFCQ